MKNILETLLHTQVDIEPHQGKTNLPFFLMSGREFYDARIYGIGVTIIRIESTENLGIRNLSHDLREYNKVFSGNVCFYIPDITRIKRDALIKAGIPFIAPPGQVYLPFLGVILQDKYGKLPQKRTGGMSPLEQEVLLYLIYNAGEHGKAKLADQLNVTRAAITKVTESLAQRELINETRHGKEISVSLLFSPQITYKTALNDMITPVKKRVCCRKSVVSASFLPAGESALSEVSMLSAPTMEYRAVYEKDERIQQLEFIEDECWMDTEDGIMLELWRYDPEKLSQDGRVDPISLKLSLSDIYDERVQGEMEDVLEGYKWL